MCILLVNSALHYHHDPFFINQLIAIAAATSSIDGPSVCRIGKHHLLSLSLLVVVLLVTSQHN